MLLKFPIMFKFYQLLRYVKSKNAFKNDTNLHVLYQLHEVDLCGLSSND